MRADADVRRWVESVAQTSDARARQAVRDLSATGPPAVKAAFPSHLFHAPLLREAVPVHPYAGSPPVFTSAASGVPSADLSTVDAALAEAEGLLQRESSQSEKDEREQLRLAKKALIDAQQRAVRNAEDSARAQRRAVINAYRQQPASTPITTSSALLLSLSFSPASPTSSPPPVPADAASVAVNSRESVLRLKAEIALRAEQRRRDSEQLDFAQQLDQRRRAVLAQQQDDHDLSQRALAAATRAREQQLADETAKAREEDDRRTQAKREVEERKRQAAEEIRQQREQHRRQQREAFIQQRAAQHRRERERRALRGVMAAWRELTHQACRERYLKAVSVWGLNVRCRHFTAWRESARTARQQKRAAAEAQLRRLREERQAQADEHWRSRQTLKSVPRTSPWVVHSAVCAVLTPRCCFDVRCVELSACGVCACGSSARDGWRRWRGRRGGTRWSGP